MGTRNLTIITGASRGMGLAMAQQLLQAGHDLLCIARHPNEALQAQAAAAGRRCEQWPQDLARADAAAARLATWLQAQAREEFASATLINNAGLVPPIAPLAETPAAGIADGLRVDLEAPMLLTAAFLQG